MRKIVDEHGSMIRTACYIRVSSQEQKLHGISLDAQIDKLTEYANTHNLKIIEWYKDEGVSGRKLIKNRPELQRMLNDAHAGKFDRIIFIKLDRFFRSVAEYHECMKYIEPVVWTATEEKYDLSTANGRAFVNMKLTIAELEADQTGERIKIVNDYKVKTGQALTGSQSQGYGYTVQKIDGIKRVVKDPETAPIVEDFINNFLTYQNQRHAYIYTKEKYNLTIQYNNLRKVLYDTKLYGSYRGNEDYIADPYVDKKTFEKIQELLKVNIKKTSSNRIYLFTGLIKCPTCGTKLSGKYLGGTIKNKKANGKIYEYPRNYYYYRCNKHYASAECDFNSQINESKIEKALLDNFDQYVNDYITTINVSDNRADLDNETINKNIKAIKSEMKNLNTLFRKDRITEAEYDKDYNELEAELKALEVKLEPLMERDLTIYEDILKSGWKELYEALNKENKRAFWRKYIKEIVVDKNGKVVNLIFF